MRKFLKKLLSVTVALALLSGLTMGAYGDEADEETTEEQILAASEAEVTYTAKRVDTGGTTYNYTGENGLLEAINAAQSGDTVTMLTDQTLSESVTIPEGVTVVIPCKDDDPGYVDGFCPAGPGDTKALYATLTIPADVTVTVNGTLLVNAVTGALGGQPDQGYITGGWAEIKLDGTIIATGKNARLENFGYIKGGGAVYGYNGASVGDRYEVVRWRGGTNGAGAFCVNVYPMNETNCHSIQTPVTIDSQSWFYGLVRMSTQKAFYLTRFLLIGPEGAMIKLNDEATTVKTYDGSRSTVTLSGGATFPGGSMVISGVTASTKNFVFPIDGDVDFVLKDGVYDANESYKFLPGSSLTMESGATLIVPSEKTLAMYESFDDPFNANKYPSGRSPAELILHGGSSLWVYGDIGGHVRLADDATGDNYARLVLISGSKTSTTTKESDGEYNNLYPTEFTFPLQLFNSGATESTLTPAAGTTYYGTASGWTTTSPVKLPGDLDNNNVVNSRDLNTLLSNYNQSGVDLDGDIDSNGIVNSKDLNALLSNYNQTA